MASAGEYGERRLKVSGPFAKEYNLCRKCLGSRNYDAPLTHKCNCGDSSSVNTARSAIANREAAHARFLEAGKKRARANANLFN